MTASTTLYTFILFWATLTSPFSFGSSPLQTNPVQQEDTKTIEGIVTDAHLGYTYDRIVLSINVEGEIKDFYLHDYPSMEGSYYINKSVRLTYQEYKTKKEIDMFANGVSVYKGDNKVRDTTNAYNVEGLFDIYDYGCAMPGRYTITASDSTETSFSHYIEGKYQTAHEGKHVTVYYAIETTNLASDFKFIYNDTIPLDTSLIDTLVIQHTPVYTESKHETTLTIIDVREDSRCPTDVQCKWAGNAKVSLKITESNNKELHLILDTNDTMENEIEIGGYSYKLIELTPKPTSGMTILPANYRATLLIVKR